MEYSAHAAIKQNWNKTMDSKKYTKRVKKQLELHFKFAAQERELKNKALKNAARSIRLIEKQNKHIDDQDHLCRNDDKLRGLSNFCKRIKKQDHDNRSY